MYRITLFLIINAAIFGQTIVWEVMPTPAMTGTLHAKVLSDSSDVLYFIGSDVFVSEDSAQSWSKIYNSNELGYFWEVGIWNEKLTGITTEGKIFQYQKDSDTWISIQLSPPQSIYYGIRESANYEALVMRDRVYFREKTSSEWDSLQIPNADFDPGILIGDELFRVNESTVETYNILSGAQSVIYSGSGNIEDLMYNNGLIIFTESVSGTKSVHYSTDLGVNWIQKSFVEVFYSFLLGVDLDGQVYKMSAGNVYYSDDTCSTWRPMNIAFVEPNSDFALNYRIKYAYTDGIKRYTGESITPYQGENFVPMHTGNKYLLNGHGWSSMYNYDVYSQTEIVKDTLIEGESFYLYSDGKYYSYNDSTKIYRQWYDGEIFNKFDFSLPEGAPFAIQSPGGSAQLISVRDEYKSFFFEQRYCKGYDVIDAFRIRRFYAENIGFLYEETFDISSSGGTDLAEAYIYSDSLGDFIYYTKGYKTSIMSQSYNFVPPLNLTVSGMFEHPYDGAREPGPASSFIDTVYFNYAFGNETIETEFTTKFALRPETHENMEFLVPLTDSILVNYSKLFYTFRTVDKNLVADTKDFPASGTYIIYLDDLTEVEFQEKTNRDINFGLEQNYPNPFNPETTINFTLVKPGIVKLTIYNTLGQQVKTLVNGELSAGNHDVQFYGTNLASGTYFYKLETGEFTSTKKMILMK